MIIQPNCKSFRGTEKRTRLQMFGLRGFAEIWAIISEEWKSIWPYFSLSVTESLSRGNRPSQTICWYFCGRGVCELLTQCLRLCFDCSQTFCCTKSMLVWGTGISTKPPQGTTVLSLKVSSTAKNANFSQKAWHTSISKLDLIQCSKHSWQYGQKHGKHRGFTERQSSRTPQPDHGAQSESDTLMDSLF